jgi:hypothetical protein
VGWIESSAQKINKTQEKALLDNVIELMEAVKPGSEARATLSTVLHASSVCRAPCAAAGGHAAASLGRAPAEDMVSMSVDTALPAHLI